MKPAIVALSLVLVGCPPAKKQEQPKATCDKVGDSCMFEPGKLGLCVDTNVRSGPPKLVCQSQH